MSSSHATPSPPFPPPFDDVPLKEVKKKKGGGKGERDRNSGRKFFSRREQLDRQMFELSFPPRSGEGKVSSVFPGYANRESFIRKMAGLKLVEKRKVKNLSPGCLDARDLYVLRPTRLKVALLKINENSVFFPFLMKSRAESDSFEDRFLEGFVVSGFSILVKLGNVKITVLVPYSIDR